jgi:hypothetical protein
MDARKDIPLLDGIEGPRVGTVTADGYRAIAIVTDAHVTKRLLEPAALISVGYRIAGSAVGGS